MFGTDIGGVRRTRSYTGESTAGLAKSAQIAKAQAEASEAVSVKVEALLMSDGTYTLEVAADGQTAARSGVEPETLADTLSRIIQRLSKALAADGTLSKYADAPVRMGGMSVPRGNRHNVRFTA